MARCVLAPSMALLAVLLLSQLEALLATGSADDSLCLLQQHVANTQSEELQLKSNSTVPARGRHQVPRDVVRAPTKKPDFQKAIASLFARGRQLQRGQLSAEAAASLWARGAKERQAIAAEFWSKNEQMRAGIQLLSKQLQRAKRKASDGTGSAEHLVAEKRQLQEKIAEMSGELEELQQVKEETTDAFLSRQEIWMNSSQRLLREKQELQDRIVKLTSENSRLQKEKEEASGSFRRRDAVRQATEAQWKNSTIRLLNLKRMTMPEEQQPPERGPGAAAAPKSRRELRRELRQERKMQRQREREEKKRKKS